MKASDKQYANPPVHSTQRQEGLSFSHENTTMLVWAFDRATRIPPKQQGKHQNLQKQWMVFTIS